jgi:flagellar secretion chaperone FliS
LSTPHQAYSQNQNAYLEHKVLSASPLELVCMLYEGAIDAVVDAKRHLAADDVLARGRAISRVQAIIVELLNSLNSQVDQDLARRLTLLYDYVLRKLEEGHREQSAGPLDEAEQLLRNLHEGWKVLCEPPSVGAGGTAGPRLA